MDRKQKPKAATGWILGSLLASAAILAGQGLAHAGNVEDSIRAALDTNPEIGVVREDKHAVEQELRQARGLALPQVDVRAAIGPEWTNSTTTRRRATRPAGAEGNTTLTRMESQITLTQMLFDGFATRSEIDRQIARVDSAAYRVEEAAEFIALGAVEAHLDILRNEELVALARDNLAAHERILGQVRELERLGRTGIADVRQGEARLGNAQVVLATAEGNLLDAIANYRKVVGGAPSALTRPLPPLAAVPESAEAAAGIASTRSPTVLIGASDVDVASAELTGARAGFYPRLDLELGARADENIDGVKGGNVGAQAMLVMRYNLFRGGADMAREREAFARMNEARQELHRARRQAEQEARLSHNALVTARARAAALRNQVEAQRRTRDAYASQFEVGQRTLLDVLDSENELFVGRSQLVTADFTELFAVYRVLAVTGMMLETLDIERPRETISIWRTPEAVHTDESVDAKTGPIRHPREEPQPFRPDPPTEPLPPEARVDAGATTALAAAPAPAAPAEYETFDSFFRTVFRRGGDDASEAAAAAVTPAAAPGARPVAAAGLAPAAPAPAPAEYETFDSFFATIFGRRRGTDQAAEPAPPPEPRAALDGTTRIATAEGTPERMVGGGAR